MKIWEKVKNNNIFYFVISAIVCVASFLFFCWLYTVLPCLWIDNSDKPNNETVVTFSTGIVSSIALASAIVAIFLQKQELEETRLELLAQKEKLDKQNIIMQEQKFEQTFNSLYASFKQTLLNVEGTFCNSQTKETKKGCDYLTEVLRIIDQSFLNDKSKKLQVLENLSPIFYQFFYLVSLTGNEVNLTKSSRENYLKRLSMLSFQESLIIALFVISGVCDQQVSILIKNHNILGKLKNEWCLIDSSMNLKNIKEYLENNINRL